MRTLTVVLASAMVVASSVHAASAENDRDRVVAETGAGRILYRMIACSDGDTVPPSDCHRREQQMLASKLRRQWIAAAVRKYAVTLSPEEERLVTTQTKSDEPHIIETAKRFHAVADAALRVRRGEAREHVLADLSKQGATARELDWELEHVPTLEAAQRAAAKDYVADGRRAARESHAEPYLLLHLRDLLDRRAAAEHVKFDVVERRFWSEIARETHTRIVDPAFTMPEEKGILVRR